MRPSSTSLCAASGLACLALSAPVLAAPALAAPRGGPAQAGLDGAVAFAIAAQPLDMALLQYSRQSGVQVISSASVLANKTAPAVQGMKTRREGLAALLRGSNLGFAVAGEDTVAITALAPAPAKPAARIVPAALQVEAAPRPAAAQAPDPVAPGGNQLEAIVVTATRQAESVDRVPIAVTAQTQRMLDQQAVRSVRDLQGIVPGLQISPSTASGASFPAIRGIFGSGDGVTATTGVYLDDTPLQKRNPNTNGQGGGTPFPPIFDLERIEVLRGPQGTLFGGGSEGGAIRYITPQPSLTRYSAYGRAEVSDIKYGSASYEGGAAVGGPIVQDRLGFRISAFARNNGGWIDLVDRNTGQVATPDANASQARLFRAALAWAPTDRSRVTLSYFSSREHQDARVTGFELSIPTPIVEPTSCFNTKVITPAKPVQFPAPVAVGAANCAAAVAAGRADFTRPGATYGPYDLGVGRSIEYAYPATTNIQVGTLTLDYDFTAMTMKSITSYVQDQTKSLSNIFVQLTSRNSSATVGSIGPINRGVGVSSLCAATCLSTMTNNPNNHRYGLTQEVRFASAANARPLSWVGGVFYSNMRLHNAQLATMNQAAPLAIEGLTIAQQFGVPLFETSPGVANGFERRDGRYKDVELAGFGEANYWIGERVRLTAGLRVSRVSVDFAQDAYGPVYGTTAATYASQGFQTRGSTAESPITPRFTAQYQLSPDDMVYATAAKGFRAGGVNVFLPLICNQNLAPFGLTINDIAKTYNSDSTWNYELGGKVRAFGDHAQINGALYRVDWTNTQVAVTLPGGSCGFQFISNAGQARSQGAELEVQARLVAGLSANLAASYVDAKYTEDAVAIPANPANPSSAPLLAAMRGQKINTPPFTLRLGARYEAQLATGVSAYARADLTFQKGVTGTAPQTFGSSAYTPDWRFPDTFRTDLRVGINRGALDVNLFVNNLFDTTRGPLVGGRSGCQLASAGGTAACTTYTTYTVFMTQTPAYLPRQIGVQAAFRY